MIDPADVAAVIVTRGDVSLKDPLTTLKRAGLGQVEVWNNQHVAEDLGVYGRYAAIELTDAQAILVQDDDVQLPPDTIKKLLAAYQPRKLVANLPAGEYRRRYTDSTMVGFGAIFDRDLPNKAFARFRENVTYADEEIFRRTCDVVFTTLTPFVLVDLPFTYLEHTYAENRMYRMPNHTTERQKMLHLARAVRDAR